MSFLNVSQVLKSYDGRDVVHQVDLSVSAGERVALLGHNGAGKTTLIRMILGLTTSSGGTIEIGGAAPGSRSARGAIGYLPESVAFHGALSGRDQLRHFARLKSVSAKVADDLLERVGLGDAATRKIRTYSKGMRQRVGLAQAILGRPKLVLLDEPTSGLDPISRHEFYDIVQELSDNGTAVLLSSHALTELETRTDRIAIMSGGKLVADADLATLRQEAAMPIMVKITTSVDAADKVADQMGGTRVNGRIVVLTCLQNEKMPILSKVTALGTMVEDVDVNPASLEQLYRYYSGVEGAVK